MSFYPDQRLKKKKCFDLSSERCFGLGLAFGMGLRR